MPSCVVTVTGTTGSVEIRYILTGTAHVMTGIFGETLYINDAATEITYTNISGNAAASSACVTITNLPSACYIVDWSLLFLDAINGVYGYLNNTNYTFTGVIINNVLSAIAPINYNTLTPNTLANAINNLNNYRLKATAVRSIISTNFNEYFLVLKTIGSFIPEVKINNPSGNHTLYLKGVVSGSCLPVGYTAIDICNPILP